MSEPMRDASFLDLPELALRPSNAALCAMLRLQTDLFVGASSRPPATLAAYEAFAKGAILLVDEPCAVEVARRLAPCPDAPREVLAALHALGGAPAREIVAGLPCVLDAAGIARTGAAAACDGLARRGDLSDDAVVALVARDIAAVDLVLAANHQAGLPHPALDNLVERGGTRPDLAALLLARPDISAADKAPLYLFADVQLRETILTALLPTAFLRLRPARLPDETSKAIVAAARSRDEAGLRAQLGKAARLPPAIVDRFVLDPSGDGLAILMAALGLAAEEAAAVFLSREAGISHSVDAVFALVRRVRTTQPALAGALVDAIAGDAHRAARKAPPASMQTSAHSAGSDMAARARPEPARRPQPSRYAGIWSAKG